MKWGCCGWRGRLGDNWEEGGGAKERVRVKKKVGIHRYRLVQPTDVNENKELPPSSDFLSPLSTSKPGGRGTSKAENSARNEKRIRKRSAGGGCEETEGTREISVTFTRARPRARASRLQRRAIISLPRNKSFVKTTKLHCDARSSLRSYFGHIREPK